MAAILLLVSTVVGGCGSAAESKGGAAARWEVAGPLLTWDGTLWVVDGLPIVVPPALGVDEQRVVGAQVAASGRVDERGRRVATAIVVRPGGDPVSTLPAARASGTIAAIDGDTWLLDAMAVIVPEDTELVAADPGADPAALAAVGSFAAIEGYASDAGVIATRVVLTAPAVEVPPATPTSETQPTAEPAPPADDNAEDDGGDENGDEDDSHGKDDVKRDRHDNGNKKKKSVVDGALEGVTVALVARWSRQG